MRKRSLACIQLILAMLVVAGSSGACITAGTQKHTAAPTGAKTTSEQFDTLRKRADEARDAGRLDEAAKLYHHALATNPKWTEGWWSLGTLHYDGDRYAE